jgi:hypothetical protein
MRFRTSILAFSFLFLAAAFFLGRDARAQAATATFDAVTSYAVTGSILTITGVQHGASAPSTFSASNGGTTTPSVVWQACQQQVLVMINRPGRFSLTIAYAGNTIVSSCSLTQLP